MPGGMPIGGVSAAQHGGSAPAVLSRLQPSSDAIDEMRAGLRELREGQRELRALVLQMLEASRASRAPPEPTAAATAAVRTDAWFADVEERAAKAEAEVERLRAANGAQAERQATERHLQAERQATERHLQAERQTKDRCVSPNEGTTQIEPPPPAAPAAPAEAEVGATAASRELGTLSEVQKKALSQARRLAHDGVGETQKAHGFTLIVGNQKRLLAKDDKGVPVIGEINDPEMYDYHERGFKVDEFKHLQTAVKEDGAVVVNEDTGELVGANYMVCDIRCGDNAGGARHRSASAVAQLAGPPGVEKSGCFVVKASEDACGPRTDERGHLIQDSSAKLDVFLPGERLPVKVPVHDSAKVLGLELINAARNGEIDTVLDVISQGVNVNYQDMNGATPLWMSAVYGRAQIVRILLKNGANPDLHTNHAKTPLYEAADNGYEDIVRMLLDAGANRHIAEKNGRIPIDVATASIRAMLKDDTSGNTLLTAGAATEISGKSRRRLSAPAALVRQTVPVQEPDDTDAQRRGSQQVAEAQRMQRPPG